MRFVCLFCWLLLPLTLWAQTPFTAVWSFDGENKAGVSTNAAVLVSDMATSNVTVSTINTIAYVAGQSGKAVNVQSWTTTGCNDTEYVTFTITPASGAKLTVTQFSLYFNQSPAGPTLLRIRSSADNFAGDLYSQAVTGSFQQASISVSNLVDQTGPISFRVYACSAMATGGALRLDEVTINGSITSTPLPVTLLYFTAKPEGDRVQLAWATTQEINADRFRIEHSLDLTEYTLVGEINAKGTTDERQYYGLTDLNPQPGINYYRLKQIDRDGSTQIFKPVAAIIRDSEPVVTVYPNPADTDRIHLRLWNADDASVRLLTITGQSVSGQLQRTPGEADFRPDQSLPLGFYWLEITTTDQRRTLLVLVR